MRPVDSNDWTENDERRYRQKQAEVESQRKGLFNQIAKDAIDLKFVGNTKTWEIDQSLTNRIVEEKVMQELCNAIIAAHAEYNGQTDALGYPPKTAKKLVEQAYKVDLLKTNQGYSLTLTVKAAFSFSNN